MLITPMKIASTWVAFLLVQLSCIGLMLSFGTSVQADSSTPGIDTTWIIPFYKNENFTIIALPDTQYYSERYPSIFDNQTQWIIENIESMNIVFVTHLGDLVDHWWVPEEYENANTSMSKLDGNIPYGILPGNHDGAELGGDFYYYNKYFGFERYQNEIWYGGAFQNINTNNYQLFSAAGDNYLILHIQNDPNDEVLTWAGNVIANHPNHRVIVSTHYYIEWSREGAPRSDVGNRIWEKLVVPHSDQIFMVLCGHVERERVRTDLVGEHEVIQMVSDYQDRNNGGNGFLRILTFSPINDKIYVKTYSPYLNKFELDSDSEFTLDYDMTPTKTFIELASNSSVSEFVLNQQENLISFNVSGEEKKAGYCNVTIPKKLIQGEALDCLINGKRQHFQLYENTTHRAIYLTYEHNTILSIRIMGTHATSEQPTIPEFGPNLFFLFLTLALIIKVILKNIRKIEP